MFLAENTRCKDVYNLIISITERVEPAALPLHILKVMVSNLGMGTG
jgi:hypothetical protein